MSESQQKFAYCGNEVRGNACPALAAGRAVLGEVEQAAGEYDDAVYELDYTTTSCIISEEEAKEAWNRAIERLEEEAETTPEPYQREDLDKIIDVAIEIRDELGWDDE